MTGELEVRKQGQRLGFLSDGAFFGEVPILDDSMGSQIRLRTITAMTDSRLCFITADAIAGEPPRYCWHLGCILVKMPAMSLRAGLRDRYPELALRMMRFAKVGGSVGKTSKKGLKMMEAEAIKRSLQQMNKKTAGGENAGENSNDCEHRQDVMKSLQRSASGGDEMHSPFGREGHTLPFQEQAGPGDIQVAAALELMEAKIATLSEQLNRKMDWLIAAQNPTVPDGFRMP